MRILKIIRSPMRYAKVAMDRIKNKWWVWTLGGDKVVCIICDWKGKRFIQGKCPKCGSLPRTRLMPFGIDHFKLAAPALSVLHVAPNQNELNSVKKVWEPMARYDRLNIRAVKNINLVRDLTNTGLPSNTYDREIIWHVLEHIPEDTKAITELYRLLKSGGKLLVSVPIYPEGNERTFEDKSIPYSEYETVHGHDDHCRSCGLDYYKRFEKVGFSTETLEVKNLKQKEIERYGLRKDHVVWCFTKNES